jgi:hypothetical protein
MSDRPDFGPDCCIKCGRTSHIHEPHIVARSDGGSNDAANLCWLCIVCHTEWHSIEHLENCLTFEQWLEAPQLFIFLSVWRGEWPADVSAAELRKLVRRIHREKLWMKANAKKAIAEIAGDP